jgi:isochorismate synthase
LAGTKKIGGHFEPDWTSKEITEQEYVTEAITDCLQKVTSIIKISRTVTHRAGPVAHLRTDITGILKKGKATLDTISETLHPTPAVCGTPQKFAKEFILEKEGYDREFYTGFVGPVNRKDSNSFLFVNLRCAKIEEGMASFYVGGGITSDSIPESEWVETQNKLQSMLQVLHPFLK